MKKTLNLVVAIVGMTVLLGLPISRTPIDWLSPSAAAAAPGCGGVFVATADASVGAGSPTTARGGEQQLRVASGRAGMWRTLLTFDIGQRIPTGATVQSAQLELALTQAPRPLPYTVAVYAPGAPWNEAQITWQTQPALEGSYGKRSSRVSSGIVTFDVTALVSQPVSEGAAEASLVLLPALREMSMNVASREGSSRARPGPRLVVRCAAAPEAQPVDQSAGDRRQMASIARLRASSAAPTTLELDRGVVRFAMFDIAAPQTAGNDNLSRAEWFLNEYRDLLRVSDPARQLQLKRRSADGEHLFFRQLHNGIPVWPSELAVHLQDDHIMSVSGDYLPAISLPATPRLPATRAEVIALANGMPRAKVQGDTQLRYVNLSLLGGPDTRTSLAWQVNLGEAVAQQAMFVDALNGKVLLRYSHEMTDFDLDYLFDANHTGGANSCSFDEDDWFDEDGVLDGANPDAEGFQAFNNIKATYNAWKNSFGRDSYDDDGEDIEMYIHVGNPYNNASYNAGCDIFKFGDGYTPRDVMGHEFSHAVDSEEGDLEYLFQSGALDESFADIFGHFMDTGDWTIGEDLPGGAIRDMSNPPAFNDPDQMSEYVSLSEDTDNGGVHTNSGINNKAAFLLTAGGTFNGRTVNGIGQSKAQKLFYKVLTNYLGSNAKMKDARNGAFFHALLDYGPFSSELCAVRNAYAAVEIGQGDADCDGAEDNVDSDSDGDGVSNASDNCPTAANPYQGNSDGDSQGDTCDADDDNDGDLDTADNCKLFPNANQADFNGDGQGDVCDDTDNDGIMDSTDNCRQAKNYDQKDSDWDGKGDVCDSDRDGDGVSNATDNCPDTYNPSQKDSDGDGVGDACDLCPDVQSSDNGDPDGDGLGNPCDPDNDNDGVLDAVDNCPLVANANQLDINNNGIGYACDEAEQSMMQEIMSIQLESVIPTKIPIPVPECIQCQRYLPEGYEEVITVALPVGFRARVIDSAGMTVGKSSWGSGKQVLSFEPQPFADATAGNAQTQAASAATRFEANDVRYSLVIFPGKGVVSGKSYRVEINLAGQQN